MATSRIMGIFENCNSNDFVVAVHNGKFHLDELMSVYFLRKSLIIFTLIRTRDPKVYENADLVIDLGGKNEGKYFDHHQRDFKEFYSDGIKLAACGLVWRDIREIFLNTIIPTESQEIKDFVGNQIERFIVHSTDATDNGQTGPQNSLCTPSLANIISSFNSPNAVFQDMVFEQAYACLKQIVDQMISSWIGQAHDYVKALQAMRDQAKSNILVLEEPCSWLSPVLDNWEEFEHFKLCVFKDITNPEEWRVQSFPGSRANTFEMRCPAPQSWRGYRIGEDIPNQLPHSDQITFIHPAGFIGGIRCGAQVAHALDFAQRWIQLSNNS